MNATSVLVAGVGGQGLVLATRILAQVALSEGHDVKSSDVIGLAQRGGMVWGSVRFGKRVHSPLIPAGTGDYLLGLESLEGLRWLRLIRPEGKALINTLRIHPNQVLLGQADYPSDLAERFARAGVQMQEIDAEAIAEELGNRRLANTVMLGALASHLPFAVTTWQHVVSTNVPPKTIELNLVAFERGMRQS